MSIFNQLLTVEDPRINRCKKFPLGYILTTVFTATISGCSSWYEIEDYAEEYKDDLEALYERISGESSPWGVPSHDTLNRAISLLDPKQIELVYKAFLEESFEITTGKHICLDGKTMRGVKKLDFDADSHCVTAFDPKQQASLAQVYISTKSNEINAIKEILKALDLRDSVITIDAIGTQTEIAKAVVEKEGDYILQVKDNQKLTKEEVQSFFCPLYDAHIVHQEQKDFGHGRIETRTMSSIVNPLSLDPDSTLGKWAGLKSIHMMTRVRTDKKTDKSTSETTFYISSLTDGTEVFKLIREHWAVENKLHYMLDMLFREDYSTKRARNAAQNMNIINKINLTIIQRLKDKLKGTSTLRLRKKLARMTPEEIFDIEL